MDYHELLAPHDFEPIDKSKRGKERKKKLIKLTKKQNERKSKNPRKRKQKAQGLINERNYQHSPPDTATFRIIERHLKRRIKAALNDEDYGLEYIDDPLIFAVMRKAIRKVVKNLEETLSWFREEYKRYLIPDKEIFFHKKWIWKNKKISENLARKRNSKLIPLMNYLCNHRLGWEESRALGRVIGAVTLQIKTKKGEDVRRILVLAKPDLEDIKNKLNMSQSLIQKYLKGMSESGFIRSVRKLGANKQKAYALGYYLPYSSETGRMTRYKSNWFLKDTKEMRQALMSFNRPE